MVEKQKLSGIRCITEDISKYLQPLKAIKDAPSIPMSKSLLTNQTSPITKILCNDEVEEKKKRGTCFHYDKKYTYGHNCKKILNIEGYEEVTAGEEEKEMGPETQENNPYISLNALEGKLNPATIKVVGKVKNNTLAIFVENGSTQSF